MGIKGLTSLLTDEAPGAIRQMDIKTLFGRKVAIDASMSLYQFLIAVRQSDGQQMMSEAGEITSHLLGFFYRTLRMIDYGIKPAYVFDGKPPDLKKEVLSKRFGKREEARTEEEEQKDVADEQRLDQLARRQVRPTREHNAEVQRLLTLMGIPWVVVRLRHATTHQQAPCEAEAQCAELARAGKVFAAGSEDMDTLTFGAPILLRNLTASEQKKLPVTEIILEKALEGLGMPMSQFVDLCLLLGCDYLDPVHGVGPKTALRLIQEHKTLDSVLASLTHAQKEKEMKKKPTDDAKAPSEDEDAPPKKRAGGIHLPEIWPYEAARKLFTTPDVHDGSTIDVRECDTRLTDQLKWDQPDVDGLVGFLCGEKGFSEERVRRGCEKLAKAVGQKQQGRLDGFFTPSKLQPVPSAFERAPFSPQWSADGSFSEPLGEDHSHFQSHSFEPARSHRRRDSDQHPLFSSTQTFKSADPAYNTGRYSDHGTAPMSSGSELHEQRGGNNDNGSVSSNQELPRVSEPYPWMTMNNIKEPDDDLHDPTKRPHFSGVVPQRAVLNLGTMIILILAVLMLFAGYPILHYVMDDDNADSRADAIAAKFAPKDAVLPSGFPLSRANSTKNMLIDPDTPQEAHTLKSVFSKGSQKEFQLVFSDEFNTDGRSFYPGEDPFWEAVDLHYWATNNYEWYDPAAVTTRDGALRIQLSQHPEHNLNFRGGMIQSWNKFCFTGGILIGRVQMPGTPRVGGLWPAFWAMGNLGRAGYGATLQGTWPYSYAACDVGTVMNQTIYNATHPFPTGYPPDALKGGDTVYNRKHNSTALSFLPGQKLSACTCPGEDHPGPFVNGAFTGRAAPEIDVFEAQTSNGKVGVSQSLQMAPYNWLYNISAGKRQTAKRGDVYTIFSSDGKLNSYDGEVTQQSISGVSDADQDAVQYVVDDDDVSVASNFAEYSFEYAPGEHGYAAWTSAGKPTWEVYDEALAADPRARISNRLFPAEPMYILLNLGVSQSFGTVEWSSLKDYWPFEMSIDWVRVYQDPDAINIGCSPKDYPTKDYINKHLEAYTNPNLTVWGGSRAEGGYGQTWPMNKLYSKGCKGTRSVNPGDPDASVPFAPYVPSSKIAPGQN
ncbi:hypothetical protein MSPP1_001292 [Malassezia sp. CBS 17886]|nr:hypothetical protein MSPP1_001292 [Malassezia sp. CBS 17886]